MKSLLKQILNEKDLAQRSFVKLKEGSGLGADFDKAQRAYDARMPDEDEPEIECPECGGPGKITKSSTKGKYYSWEAECPDCHHKWGDDNFQ